MEQQGVFLVAEIVVGFLRMVGSPLGFIPCCCGWQEFNIPFSWVLLGRFGFI